MCRLPFGCQSSLHCQPPVTVSFISLYLILLYSLLEADTTIVAPSFVQGMYESIGMLHFLYLNKSLCLLSICSSCSWLPPLWVKTHLVIFLSFLTFAPFSLIHLISSKQGFFTLFLVPENYFPSYFSTLLLLEMEKKCI